MPTQDTMQEIRTRLEARLEELLQRARRIDEHRRQTDTPLSADSEEQAIDLETEEVLTGLDAAARQEIARIRVALKRFERGDYGVCESCGGPIPAGRLVAIPGATLCVRCASERER